MLVKEQFHDSKPAASGRRKLESALRHPISGQPPVCSWLLTSLRSEMRRTTKTLAGMFPGQAFSSAR